MNEEMRMMHVAEWTWLDGDGAYLLFILPLLLWLGWSFYKRRQAARESLRFHFTVDLPLLIIIPAVVSVLTLFATIRPSVGTTIHSFPVDSRSLFILFDVSESMRAEDVAPNRFGLGKRKLLDLVDAFESGEERVRIGIVVFAGQSAVFCPLTADYGVLRLYIKNLSPDLISSPGSALVSALRTAEQSARSLELQGARILLVSDGERSDQAPIRSTLPVDIFAVGTTQGAPIPLPSGSLLKDSNGDIVVTVLEDAQLKSLASTSGGRFFRLALGEPTIQRYHSHFAGTDGSEATQEQTTITRHAEIGFIAMWIMLFALAVLYSIPVRAGLLLLLLIPFFTLQHNSAHAADRGFLNQSIAKAKRLYIEEQFEPALELLEEIVRHDPENASALQTLGSTLYRLQQFKEAEVIFERLSEATDNGRETFQALYNAGNSALLAKKPDHAISYYDRALQIKPEDEKTLFNRKLAEQLKEEQQEQKQQEQDKNQDQEEDSDQDESEQQDSSSEEKQDEQEKEKQEEQKSENDEEKSGEEQKPEEEKPSEGDEDKQESQLNEQEQDEMKSGQEQQVELPKSEPLNSEEAIAAQRWLDSLPESPLLVPKLSESAKEKSGGQTW